MEEIRSCWQIPSIAHYSKIFRKDFHLPHFDDEDLEVAFLERLGTLEDDSEYGSDIVENNLLLRLIISLLTGYYTDHIINRLNWESYIKKLIQVHWVGTEDKLSPFVEIDSQGYEKPLRFDDLSIRTKAEIVYYLCECRLLCDDASDLTKDINADEFRVDPLGKDSSGNIYWYFYGGRLYRETPSAYASLETKLKKIEEIKKKIVQERVKIEESIKRAEQEAEEKRKQVNRRSLPPKIPGQREGLRERKQTVNGATKKVNNVQQTVSKPQPKTICVKVPVVELNELKESWCIVCQSEQDWNNLVEKFKKSKSKIDNELSKLLFDILPSVSEYFAKKEKLAKQIEKQKFFELLPRRVSSRIELKKLQQEELEKQRELDEKEEQRRKEEETARLKEQKEKLKQERIKMERERRAQQRLQLIEREAEKAHHRSENFPNLRPGSSVYSDYDNDDSDMRSLHEEEDMITISSQSPMEFNSDDALEHAKNDVDSFYEKLEKVFTVVKNNRDAWPFKEPVDEKSAPMYYQVIERPIDLSVVQQKIQSRQYEKLRDVESDFKLMVNNCETFNGPKNGYTLMAYVVWRAFKRAVRRYFDQELSDDQDVFMYPPRPINTNIKPAIEAKKRKSKSKRRPGMRALEALAQAAEQAVRDTSSRSSVAASSPRSSASYSLEDHNTNDSCSGSECTSKQINSQPMQFCSDLLARYLYNSSSLKVAAPSTVTSPNGNLTFKSLSEWSESIKQSGNTTVLPQNAVIVNSSVSETSVNGSVPKSGNEQFACLNISNAMNSATNGNSTKTMFKNTQCETSNEEKRLVIKLSRVESGRDWRPVCVSSSQISTNVPQNSMQQSPSKLSNSCIPVKKRIYIPPHNETDMSSKDSNLNYLFQNDCNLNERQVESNGNCIEPVRSHSLD